MGARTRRPAGNGGRTVFPGQMDEAAIRDLIKERGELAAAKRLAFLQANPDYIPCSIAGCSGLVGPQYQRKAPNGEAYGFCPRRTSHSRLMPSVFAPKAAQA